MAGDEDSRAGAERDPASPDRPRAAEGGGPPAADRVTRLELWIAIDARLIVALLTYFAVGALQVAIPYGLAFLSSLPLLLIIAALMAAAVWVLRRQSARPTRTA